jgi:hypothetical protein
MMNFFEIRFFNFNINFGLRISEYSKIRRTLISAIFFLVKEQVTYVRSAQLIKKTGVVITNSMLHYRLRLLLKTKSVNHSLMNLSSDTKERKK